MKKLLKKKEGFTLVELIVVIAILAILAAVAIPAYSGYIAKANEAKDTQLLSAINTAFAAACTENSRSITDVTASVTVASKKVTGITVTDPTGDSATKIQNAFLVYFAGNTDQELGYYTSFTQTTDGNFEGTK